MNRRAFLKNTTLTGAAALAFGRDDAAAGLPDKTPVSSAIAATAKTEDAPARSELVVAGVQMIVSADVQKNEAGIRRAIDQAAQSTADFLLTPEGSLSGYRPDFDQTTVAAALERVTNHAKEARVGLLLGTCWKEREIDGSNSARSSEYCYDQVRVYASSGEFLGSYSKILLCSSLSHPGSGEMRDYISGSVRVFSWNGICFGVLICNDLWATPGFSTISNPYLAWQLKKLGAQLIFHAVNAVGPLYALYRPFHESSQSLWATHLGISIVTTNATDGANPSCCRAGIIGPDGERKLVAGENGEQFFAGRAVVA